MHGLQHHITELIQRREEPWTSCERSAPTPRRHSAHTYLLNQLCQQNQREQHRGEGAKEKKKLTIAGVQQRGVVGARKSGVLDKFAEKCCHSSGTTAATMRASCDTFTQPRRKRKLVKLTSTSLIVKWGIFISFLNNQKSFLD